VLLIFNIFLDILTAVFALWLWRRRKGYEKEEKLLAEQEHFLDELASAYGRRGDMLEALEESMQLCGGEGAGELLRMLDALRGELGEEYDFHGKNTYFLLLYTLCDTIRSYGDQQIGGVSLFVHNIRYIKEEVRLELLRRQEGRYAFLGLLSLCIIPFFFAIPMQRWCLSISESLGRFFTGSYGFVTLLLCFFLTASAAALVQELQYPRFAAGGTTLAARLLDFPAVFVPVDKHIARHYSRYLKKNETLKVLQGFGNIREFLVRKLLAALLAAGGYLLLLFGYGLAGGSGRVAARALLLLPFLMLAGYEAPDVWLLVLQGRVEQEKAQETLRFETLLLIVMHYGRITVEEILRSLERFSVIFSRALQRAVDDFSYRRDQSLEQLKEDLGYEPAGKLVDALIACDDIPVSQAFYDLEGERAYNMEQYKQKAAALQREKAALARIIAFLPFVALLALRLLIPFVLEGLTELKSYGV
jgi:hypothetical protein